MTSPCCSGRWWDDSYLDKQPQQVWPLRQCLGPSTQKPDCLGHLPSLLARAGMYARGSALTSVSLSMPPGRAKTFATAASPGGVRFFGSLLGAHCFWTAIVEGKRTGTMKRDWMGARAMAYNGLSQSQTGVLQVVRQMSKDTIQLLPRRPMALFSLHLTGGAVCSRGVFFSPPQKICLSVWSHVNVRKCGVARVKVSLH